MYTIETYFSDEDEVAKGSCILITSDTNFFCKPKKYSTIVLLSSVQLAGRIFTRFHQLKQKEKEAAILNLFTNHSEDIERYVVIVL